MPNHARRTLAMLTAVLLGASFALATAAPADAHDELVSTFPTADSTVDSSPAEITLTFSAALNSDPATMVIEVIGPDGANYTTDPPSVDDEIFVTQHLLDEAPNGLFTVRWKVVSSDGHPISGEYSYTVAATIAPAPAPTEGVAETATPEPSVAVNNDTGAEGHGESTGGGALLPVLAVVTGALILGGGAIIVLMVGRERRRRDREGAQTGTDDE
ncbi:hypothetical protein GCM10009775_33210 [Microbacterium aoyamense]|uniref:CopC domain-containing protein n=1 Tax=Microbacterium aoyamense TaxID=344166 RepID=A0ABN2Q1K5_9MICO|nr:copper resistance CopC family protein [Microbacterium aoyamense]